MLCPPSTTAHPSTTEQTAWLTRSRSLRSRSLPSQKSEADELVTVKETLRRALAATEKAQNQYTAEQEETQKLRDQLAGVKGAFATLACQSAWRVVGLPVCPPAPPPPEASFHPYELQHASPPTSRWQRW